MTLWNPSFVIAANSFGISGKITPTWMVSEDYRYLFSGGFFLLHHCHQSRFVLVIYVLHAHGTPILQLFRYFHGRELPLARVKSNHIMYSEVTAVLLLGSSPYINCWLNHLFRVFSPTSSVRRRCLSPSALLRIYMRYVRYWAIDCQLSHVS
jgi:hypothetical protein